jgi:hypothetical protein
MAECLRHIPHRFSANGDLFGEDPQMVREGEDVVKVGDGRLADVCSVRIAGQIGGVS